MVIKYEKSNKSPEKKTPIDSSIKKANEKIDQSSLNIKNEGRPKLD